VLAQGSPAAVRGEAGTANAPDPNMEEAFIAIVERARSHEAAA
jgi:hypothetical protein